MSSSQTIIEHIVLFKVKDNTEPSEVNAMVSRINSLRSLAQVLHITTGPLRSNRSPSLTFNYMLHSRYKSKDDLDAYTVHPNHVSVTKENVGLLDDIMAVDWVADDLRGPVVVLEGSALRFTILKLKEGSRDEAKSEILEAIVGMEDKIGEKTTQFTSGVNFSPGRAKGFSMAFLAVFKSQSELEAEDLVEMWANFEQKLNDYLETLIVLDYVVPPPPTASEPSHI
ncbi:hypothetical protein FNV43_RR17940 [Rhamnella rubrinervis]|uniref:Stress-response A/B barrel domain-containing protein n=1 Tax=Rhamnella rubrinervis TaxID=2594499 RepID=A0A8K0GSE4_9ROSA|nr:hypothetical protein FNV43_RR17940 [Rhamnella rubrinervis]